MAAPSSEFGRLVNAHQEAIRAGCIADARSTASEILSQVVNDMENDPEPDPDLVLCAVASECEGRGDWQGAEAAYRARLLLGEDGVGGKYRAHCDLRALFDLIGRRDEAFQHAQLATEAARGSELDVLLAMALEREIPYSIERGKYEQADRLISEIFELLEDDRMQDHLRASVLVLRARVAVAMRDLTTAEADLNAAYDFLAPLLDWKEAAGVHSTMVQWRATKARLERARANLEAARGHWIEAVVSARHVDSLEHCADVYTKATLARTLEHAAKALAEFGCPADSAAALSEAEQIWKDLKLPAQCDAAE